MCRFTRLILTLSFVVLTATSALAQDNDDERVVIDARLVSVNVSVTDARGVPIKALDKDRFEVFSDNVRQQIAHFSTEEAPLSIGIVYDIHSSTPERTDAALRALKQFTRTLRREDDFFVTVFNQRGSVVVDFVPTVDQVFNHLTYVAPKGPSALYDAIYQAAEKVNAARAEKKALLIISDGYDHQSGHSDREVRSRVKELNIQVYGIGIADPHDDPLEGRGRWVFEDITRQTGRRTFLARTDAAFGRAVLEEMSRASGGAAYFPDSRNGEQELAGLGAQILLELRRQYTLAFYPTGAQSGAGWHKIRVRVTTLAGSDGLRLSYRKGYKAFRK
ncbi:MAG TPA: VWA domain-containing protein [Pyrinomonadaceae bacterium]|nr:VWA domain-containing protein [Pyrinomonadaceae bacterium]